MHSRNVPLALTSLPQWVLWKNDPSRGKVPYSSDTKRAETNNPATWLSFDEAETELLLGDYEGLGFVFSAYDDLCGIDIDDCVKDGEIEPWAQEIIDAFDTYAEISPSGTGVKLWATGKLPTEQTGKKRPYESGDVEMYHERRFFAFTGDKLEGRHEVNDCQAAIDEWWPKVFGNTSSTHEKGEVAELDVEDVTDEQMQTHREFLATLEESIEGSNGSTSFFLACKAIRRLRLNYDQSMELVAWFNENMCTPSWDAADIAHKWNEAKKYTDITDPVDAFDEIEDEQEALRFEANSHGVDLNLMSPEDFAKGSESVRFLVESVLAAEGGFIIGGPPKCLKTAIAVDLCYSIASGTPFLGLFKVPEPKRVVFFTAETAPHAIYKRLTKLEEIRGGKWEDRLLLSRVSPQLSQAKWTDAIRHAIVDLEVDFCLVDPAYWAVLDNATQSQSGNVNVVGNILRSYSECANLRPCTMGLCHHTTKALGVGKRPSLQSLTGAGYSEWMRQGIALNRRSAYRMNGSHSLYMEVTGTAGFGGSYDLTIDEGCNRGIYGSKWDISIEDKVDGGALFEDYGDDSLTDREREVIALLEQSTSPVSERTIRNETGMNGVQCPKVMGELLRKGRVEKLARPQPRGGFGYKVANEDLIVDETPTLPSAATTIEAISGTLTPEIVC